MYLTRPIIFLIDDDDDDSEMLTDSFCNMCIESHHFSSGEKALAYLELKQPTHKQPSLIILDYNMPGKNGEIILTELKANPLTKDIMVIMYSTSLSTILQRNLIRLGAYACFIKPCTFPEVKLQAKVFARFAGHFSTINEKVKYLPF
jgi:DNA-binding response OmpR family regulator